MTLFGVVGLRITNGVGGGLNSTSAFYFITFETSRNNSAATYEIFHQNVIRPEAARMHGFKGQRGLVCQSMWESSKGTSVTWPCPVLCLVATHDGHTARHQSPFYAVWQTTVVSCCCCWCFVPASQLRYSAATSTHISILCVTLVVQSSNLCTSKLLRVNDYSAAVVGLHSSTQVVVELRTGGFLIEANPAMALIGSIMVCHLPYGPNCRYINGQCLFLFPRPP